MSIIIWFSQYLIISDLQGFSHYLQPLSNSSHFYFTLFREVLECNAKLQEVQYFYRFPCFATKC